MCVLRTRKLYRFAHTLATSCKTQALVMESTAERIDSDAAEKLIWALGTLNEKPASCLTCGKEASARRKLIAATLTKEEIEELAKCDRRAYVAERPFPSEFASEKAAGQLFDNCVKLEKFIEALRELAQN